jgi:hypothetical protein
MVDFFELQFKIRENVGERERATMMAQIYQLLNICWPTLADEDVGQLSIQYFKENKAS